MTGAPASRDGLRARLGRRLADRRTGHPAAAAGTGNPETEREARAGHDGVPGRAHSSPAPLGRLGQREQVVATGVVTAVVTSPAGRPLSLRVTLEDDTGALLLVFLGRRGIAGVAPGARLVVRGRTCLVSGRPAVYNPDYELLPADAATPGGTRP